MEYSNLTLEASEARRKWGWFVALGALLVILGLFAVFYAALVSVVAVEVIAWTMIIGGVVVGIQAFSVKGWSGTLVQLIGAVLLLVFGLVLALRPGVGVATIGLLLGAFFLAEGLQQLFTGLTVRIRGRGWLMASGIISLVLGVMVLAGWPISALWLIGTLVGVDLLSNGALVMAIGFEVRRRGQVEVPTATTARAPA